MSFENTRSSLDYLEQRKEITSFDILNLFHNLCNDAEDLAGSKVEKMPCKNVQEDDFVSALVWCSKKIVRVINKNKENIKDPYYADSLESEINKLNKNIDMLETQNQQANEKIEEKQNLLEIERKKKQQLLETEMEGKRRLLEQEKQNQQFLLETEESAIKELEERKKELLAIKGRLDDKIREKDDILSICSRLQNSIGRFQNVNLPQLHNQKEELQTKENTLKGQIVSLKEELREIEERISQLQDENKALKTDKELKMIDFKLAKEDWDKISGEIREIKEQTVNLQNDIKNKQADYAIEKAGLDQLGGKQQELIRMIQKLREDQGELNIDILLVRKEQEQMTYERKKREYEAEEQKIKETKQEHEKEYLNWQDSLTAKKKEQEQEYEDKKTAHDNELISIMNKYQLMLNVLETKKQEDLAKVQAKKNEIATKKAEDEAEIQMQIDSIAIEEKAKVDAIEKKKKAVEDRVIAMNNKIEEEKQKQQKLEEQLQMQSEELKLKIKETEEKKVSVKAAISELEKQRQTLNTELNDASREEKSLREWFNGKTALTNKNSLAALNGQITVLKDIKQSLEQEFSNHCFMDAEALEKKMDGYFSDKLGQIEEDLKEFSKKYAMLMGMNEIAK